MRPIIGGIAIPASILIVLASTACETTDADSDWAGTVTEQDGVTIVDNPPAGRWEADDGWAFEEVARIGTVTGDSTYEFGSIGSIAADARGRIYVFDVQRLAVRVFDSEGRYLHAFGREGNGPGEIARGASQVLVTRGDTIVVPDIRNQRINLYSSDGRSVGSTPLAPVGTTLVWQATPDGTIVRQIRPPNTAAAGDSATTYDAIVAHQAGMTQFDTLLLVPSGGTMVSATSAGPRVDLFQNEPIWAVREDLSVLYAMSHAYRISVFEDQQLVRTFTKPFVSRPVTEDDRRQVVATMVQTLRDTGAPAFVTRALVSGIRFGEIYPALSMVRLGPSGTIWVQPSPSAEVVQANPLDPAPVPNWDVFDTEGRFLGVVSMPERFFPHVFREDRVYGIWTDELDVQYVRVFRVIRDGA